MRITRLTAENVKRLKAVTITPEGNLVVIQGDNAQGKTSVLDSIMLALGGKNVAPPKVVREGQKSARVTLELDDMVVERSWTAGGASKLEVKSKEGAKFSSPQAMLDKLVGDLSFDPLLFMRTKPPEQAALMRTAFKIDTSKLEAESKRVFEERTEANRHLKALEAQLQAMPPTADVEPIDVREVLVGLATLEAERDQAEQAKRLVATAKARMDAADRAHEAAKAALEKARLETVAASAAFNAVDEAAWTMPDRATEIAATKRILAESEAVNTRARAAAARKTKLGEQAAALLKVGNQSERLGQLDEERAKMLREAHLPVEGLAFSDAGVTLNGIPLEQASGAEQLRVSVAMGLAANPELRVMLIRDASLLDTKGMRLLAEMAKTHDAQLWVERVSDGGVGVVIEDGEVVEVRT